MAHQFSVDVRNARGNALETAIGAAPLLRIYELTAAAPANVAAAITGTLLAELELPSNWLNDASGGVKTLAGSWAGVGAAAGEADFFRVYDSTGTTCHWQGTVTGSGGGGDMTLDNVNIAIGQAVTITTCTLTEAGA